MGESDDETRLQDLPSVWTEKEMNDRPTPETDAQTYVPLFGESMVPSKLARRLEQERDEARKLSETLKAECAKISEEFGLPPTVRPADGEIKRTINGWKEALRERDEAREALMEIEDRCVDCEDACDDIQKIREIAVKALEEAK